MQFGAWVGRGVNTFGDIGLFESTVGRIPAVRHIYYSNSADALSPPNIPSIATDYTKLAAYLGAVPLRDGEIFAINWATDDRIHPETRNLASIASVVPPMST